MNCAYCHKPINADEEFIKESDQAYFEDTSSRIIYLHTACQEKIYQDEAEWQDRLMAKLDPFGEDDDPAEYVDYHQDLWEGLGG